MVRLRLSTGCLPLLEQSNPKPYLAMKYIKFIFIISFLLLIAGSVQGQINRLNGNEYGLPEPADDIQGLINEIVKWVLYIAAPACLVALVYGGVRYALSGGNEEKAEQAKQVMKYAIIGVAIVIGAYAITQLIRALIGGNVPPVPNLE